MQLPFHGVGVGVVALGFLYALYRWIKRLFVKPDMRQPTIDELKMLFGFLLLLIVAFLCAAIALGNVQEQSSFGLTQMITVLAALGGGFATWAFSTTRSDADRDKDKDKKE